MKRSPFPIVFPFLLIIVAGVLFVSRSIHPEPARSTEELLESARAYYYDKRYHIALKIFKIVQNRDPENPDAYSYAGDILLKFGDYESARKSFLIASELVKNPANEYFRLGQTYFLEKRSKEAIEAFETSLKHDPSLHINRFYIGLVHFDLLDDPEQGAVYWKDYIRLVPNDPQREKMEEVLRKLGFRTEIKDHSTLIIQTLKKSAINRTQLRSVLPGEPVQSNPESRSP